MNAICERFNRTLREQFIEFNEILLFEDLALFNQKLAEYLVLYNNKRPHKTLALRTPVEYILRENKNCNMWWTHTSPCREASKRLSLMCSSIVDEPRFELHPKSWTVKHKAQGSGFDTQSDSDLLVLS